MKLLVASSLLIAASAFSPAPMGAQSNTALNAEVSRQNFLGQAGLVVGSLVSFPMAGSAAKYGSFGAGSPLVIEAKDAEIDTEILQSAPVQKALEKVRGYRNTVQDMQKGLEVDSQLNVKPIIAKNLDFAALRDDLNVINLALEEDSQRGTDRLIRAIMQDITELEIANNQKEGIVRSPRRLEIMQGKLSKLDRAFSDYLAFGN